MASDGLRARAGSASRRHAWRGSGTSPSSRPPAPSTSGGPDRCASTNRRLPVSMPDLKSLEELEAARAEYGDAARTILAQANGQVGQRGAVADYLEVEAGFERAVETYLGDLLQYVIVERPEHAAGGPRARAGAERRTVRLRGRSGGGMTDRVLRTSRRPADARAVAAWSPTAVVGRADQRSLRRRHPALDRRRLDCRFVRDCGRAQPVPSRCRSPRSPASCFAAPHLVSGGMPARGARHSRNQARDPRSSRSTRQPSASSWRVSTMKPHRSSRPSHRRPPSIAALHGEHHRQEKAIVGYDAQVRRADDEKTRLDQKRQQLARERRQFEDERELLDRRQEEARSSIVQIETRSTRGRRGPDRGPATSVRGARVGPGSGAPRRRGRGRARRPCRARRRPSPPKCCDSKKPRPSSNCAPHCWQRARRRCVIASRRCTPRWPRARPVSSRTCRVLEHAA